MPLVQLPGAWRKDTVIVALRSENEVENTLNSTIRELPISLKEIKREALRDKFIREIKSKLSKKNTKIEETYSLCDNVLLYSERVVKPKTLQKRLLHDFHTGHPWINQMKSLMRSYALKEFEISGRIETTQTKALKTQFFPGCGRIDTALWMHYLDAN